MLRSGKKWGSVDGGRGEKKWGTRGQGEAKGRGEGWAAKGRAKFCSGGRKCSRRGREGKGKGKGRKEGGREGGRERRNVSISHTTSSNTSHTLVHRVAYTPSTRQHRTHLSSEDPAALAVVPAWVQTCRTGGRLAELELWTRFRHRRR